MNITRPFNTPILFLIFNRPDTTVKVFEAIRQIKPTFLYIAADGPRKDRSGEAEKCEQTRNLVTDNIDWPCEVKTLFRSENLGCGKAVSSAITWFFENVEEGIILEDDCLPDQSFFKFCDEMLKRYSEEDKIMMISGNNFLPQKLRTESSYYFSKHAYIWGWATWRRAWRKFDLKMNTFPIFLETGQQNKISLIEEEQKYWLNIFHQAYKGCIDTWDFQWCYALRYYEGLSIVPNKNLVKNIGFSNEATHTKNATTEILNLRLESLSSVVNLNKIEPNNIADTYVHNNFYNKSSLVRKLIYFLKIIRKNIILLLNKITGNFTIQNQINKRNSLSSKNHFNRIQDKGTNVFYEMGFNVYNGHKNIHLGSNIFLVDALINAGDSEGKVIIDDYVFFGHGVKILARGHDYTFYNQNRQQQVKEQPIHICEGAWIGTNSIILGGVVIGKHSVIGAGSIVTKDIPDYSIAVGNPAKIIKTLIKLEEGTT